MRPVVASAWQCSRPIDERPLELSCGATATPRAELTTHFLWHGPLSPIAPCSGDDAARCPAVCVLCVLCGMSSDAKMMAEKKAKKEEQKAALIAAGKGDQVAAEEARKAKVRDAKNARKAYNANPLAAKQMGLAPAKQASGFNGDKTGGKGKAAMAGGAAGGSGDGDAALKALEKKLMPLVKAGDAKVEAGDFEGGLALFQEAMDGFRGAGHKVRSAVHRVHVRYSQPLDAWSSPLDLTRAMCVDLYVRSGRN